MLLPTPCIDSCLLQSSEVTPVSSLVFCCFQQVSDMLSHLLSCLHLDLSEIKSFTFNVNNLSLPLYRAITLSFLYPSSYAHHFPSIMSSAGECCRHCARQILLNTVCPMIFSAFLVVFYRSISVEYFPYS